MTSPRARRRAIIVTESYLPTVNGVTTSVLRAGTGLLARGWDVSVVAPHPGAGHPPAPGPLPVTHLPSVPLPAYGSLRVGLPSVVELGRLLRRDRPDVVHLASPVSLGAAGARAARSLGLPLVAVYQTDLPAFAERYGLHAAPVAWSWLRRVHGAADRTLAPSSASAADLAAHGVPRVHRWARGVDADQFSPARRDGALRRSWTARPSPAPGVASGSARQAPVLVGYVGRLAAEKQVELLVGVARLPGVQLVVVGDGPCRADLQRRMPGAVFTGQLTGEALGAAIASLDLFVHTGAHETFCQAVQEALAAGVPVVAPASGGPLDLVADGVTGLLVAPSDERALTAAVAGLVLDPALRGAMASRARASVAHRTWDSLAGQLEGHYEAVLEERARAARASAADAPPAVRTAGRPPRAGAGPRRSLAGWTSRSRASAPHRWTTSAPGTCSARCTPTSPPGAAPTSCSCSSTRPPTPPASAPR